jgi:uncharacterized protein (TIGR02145 family)
MNKKRLLFSMLLVAVIATMPKGALSQVTIGQDKAPETFSVLELANNGNRGLRMPQLKQKDRDSLRKTAAFIAEENGLAEGLTIYNLDAKCIQYWNGTKWAAMGVCQPVIPSVTPPSPIGCEGSNPKPVTWMTYNLGACSATDTIINGERYDLSSAKGQMKYLAIEQRGLDTARPPYDAAFWAKIIDATIFGGFFQWGRGYKDDRNKPEKDKLGWKHAVNLTALPARTRYATDANVTADANVTITNTPLTTADLNADGQPIDSTVATQFIRTSGPGYDWIAIDATNTKHYDPVLGMYADRWGNGKDISAPTGTTPADGNPYNGYYYQKPVKADSDPCPAGWRDPTQDEWATLCKYCNSSAADDFFFTTSSHDSNDGDGDGDYTNNSFGANGTSPTYNPNLFWVPIFEGQPSDYLKTKRFVADYAIYSKKAWLGDDGTGNTNGAKKYYRDNPSTRRLYDPDEDACPSPLLFLPAAGIRGCDGSVSIGVGTEGCYWSSTVNDASYTFITNGYAVDPHPKLIRAYGHSVRCVAE